MLVIIVESRVERYKKIKNYKKQRRLKFVVFVVCFLFLLISLYKVDNTLREIMCISDKRIYGIVNDNDLYRLYLMGDEYIIDKEQIDYYLGEIVSQTKRVFRTINYYKEKFFDS